MDLDVIGRLLEIQKLLKQERQVFLSIDEIIKFLNYAMNFDEFQIWLIRNKTEGVKLSDNDVLQKFFSQITEEKILQFYDVEQNFDENNLNSIRKTLEKE